MLISHQIYQEAKRLGIILSLQSAEEAMLSVVRSNPSASNSVIIQSAVEILASKLSDVKTVAFSDVPLGHYFMLRNKRIYLKTSEASGIQEDLYRQGSNRGMSIWPQSVEVLHLEAYSNLLCNKQAENLDGDSLVAIALWAIVNAGKAD